MSHFIGGQTVAQRGKVTCLRSLSKSVGMCPSFHLRLNSTLPEFLAFICMVPFLSPRPQLTIPIDKGTRAERGQALHLALLPSCRHNCWNLGQAHVHNTKPADFLVPPPWCLHLSPNCTQACRGMKKGQEASAQMNPDLRMQAGHGSHLL